MKTKLSTLALIACLASSFAFAGDKGKSKAAPEDANAAASQHATMAGKKQDSDMTSAPNKEKKKSKHAAPAPTTQEQQFEEVLRGIYGG